jgi:transposase
MKILRHDGLGMSLYAKRMERGRFIWPTPTQGSVAITGALRTALAAARQARRIAEPRVAPPVPTCWRRPCTASLTITSR